MEVDCLQAIVLSVVERRTDKRQLVKKSIKQGFVLFTKTRPNPVFPDTPCSVSWFGLAS